MRVEALELKEQPRGWTLFADTELAAPAASIDFTNIPTGHKHLYVLGWLRSSRAVAIDDALIRLNNIATNNYYSISYRIQHLSTLTTTEVLGVTFGRLGIISDSLSTASVFSPISCFVPDYLDTSIKKAWRNTGGYLISLISGNVRITGAFGILNTLTAAINRITIFPAVGPNFVAGSRLSLYGIK